MSSIFYIFTAWPLSRAFTACSVAEKNETPARWQVLMEDVVLSNDHSSDFAGTTMTVGEI